MKKKELIIITNNKTSKQIGEDLGIKYFINKNIDLLNYNYTFLEYFLYIINNYIKEIKQFFFKNTKSIVLNYTQRYKDYNILYIIIGLIISIILFVFIFYFAVNKTYIYITLDTEIKTKSYNFVFKEVLKDEIIESNIIKLDKVIKTVYLESTFGTSGIEEKNLKKLNQELFFLINYPKNNSFKKY